VQLNLQKAATILRTASTLRPRLAIVLGSAFGQVADALSSATKVDFAELPGCAVPGVKGHAGQFIIGQLGEEEVLLQSGRLHYYEGHTMAEVAFPVRVMAAFGIEKLLLTNAAGGIADDLAVGDFMRITDHINLMGDNPLRGKGSAANSVFVDMSVTYSNPLGHSLAEAAVDCGIELKSGVLAAVQGPSYETPAEIRAFSTLGADAIAMSTVPEAIVARELNLQFTGLSCITNVAAGLAQSAISHEDVLHQSRQCGTQALKLLTKFCELSC